MKVLSWNVNGIRSCRRQGLLAWLDSQEAQVVCLQEVRAHRHQVEQDLQDLHGYHAFWHSARRPGYSGVATLARQRPDAVLEGLGLEEFDLEGRVLTLEFGSLSVVNAYFPNTQRTHARLTYKLDFCRAMLAWVAGLRARGQHVLLCGDYNIAHREIDLRNPRENQGNAGFLPQERAWMDELLDSGYVDTFRARCPEPGHYTWWSNRPGVRERNIGWRIDYVVVDRELDHRVDCSFHQPQVMGSDHCPVGVVLRS